MKTIFLPTIQSTGTWFCIELLKSQKALSEFSTLGAGESPDEPYAEEEGIQLIQTHFGDGKDTEEPEARSYVPVSEVEEWINNSEWTIIPTRDPLLALLTAQIRNPGVSHSYIINGFVALAELCQKHNIFVVPIDLYSYKSPMVRYNLLRGLFDYLGFPYEPNIAIWAMEWPVFNTVGARLSKGIKNHYYSRNIQKVIESIPGDYGLLLSKEPILKPFLKNLGYEDLLWWT
jgi:hypothetical protein